MKGGIYWLPFFFCWITAGLTSFYMFRLVIKTFWGKPQDQHLYEHAHESPLPMTIPLLVLTVMSVIGAGVAIPGGPGTGWFEHRTSPKVLVGEMMTNEHIVADSSVRAAWADQGQWHDLHAHEAAPNATSAVAEFHHHFHWAHWPTMIVATGIGLIGILLSLLIFKVWAGRNFIRKGGFLEWYQGVLVNLYGIDKFYLAVPVAFTYWISRVMWTFDKYIIDGLVNFAGLLGRFVAWVAGRIDYNGVDGAVRGTGELAFIVGNRVRRAQTGRIQDYLGLSVVGLAVVLVWVVFF
jgi:NADH-quinone oxidoreductase subunit L